MKYVLALGLFFMLAACSEPPTFVQSSNVELDSVLVLVNEIRAQGYDCGVEGKFAPAQPLTVNAKLSTAAQKHSVDLEAAHVTENMHITPAGAVNYTPKMTFTQRIDTEGYKWVIAGENAAYGFTTAQQVMKAWLESPGHCKNIMNPKFTELGLGRAGTYWTQVFASPL